MPKIPYSKRKDGRYYKHIYIGYDENGNKKIKTLYDRDWRELDKKVREFQVNLEQGKYIDRDITLGECIDLWLNTKLNLSISTKHRYKMTLNRLESIKHYKIQNIKVNHLQKIYKEMWEGSARSVVVELDHLLKKVYEYAINNNYATINVAMKTSVPQYKRGKRRSFNTDEKLAICKAYELFDNFEKAFIATLYYTGVRRGEALALQKKDFVFEENYLDIYKTLIEGENWEPLIQNEPKTLAGIRKIPIAPILRTFLDPLLKNLNDDDYVFVSRQKNLLSRASFNYKWKNIKKKINMCMPDGKTTDISPHYFRHNFATEAIYAGIPIKTVQYIMGHEKVDVLMDIYTDVKIDNNEVAQAIDCFNIKRPKTPQSYVYEGFYTPVSMSKVCQIDIS